jgi:hypothetical protein
LANFLRHFIFVAWNIDLGAEFSHQQSLSLNELVESLNLKLDID